MNSSVNLVDIAQQSQRASSVLVDMGPRGRADILSYLSLLIEKHKDDILEANTLDLEASREMAVPDLMLDWLRLTPERIQNLVGMLNCLAERPDPLQQFVETDYYTTEAKVYGQRIPLGVIALMYESFPELGAIAAGLCLKSGNALILKGGAEASQSNQVITTIIQDALAAKDVMSECIHLLPTDQNDVTRELLTLNPHIQLLIPYGRPNLVQRVLKQATVPVLKTAIGNCYLYCAGDADAGLIVNMIVDSNQGEPDAINAIDKVLIHQDFSFDKINYLLQELGHRDYLIKGDIAFLQHFEHLEVAEDSEWSQPLWDPMVLCRRVSSVQDAVAWINSHSNGHANCIATNSYQESRYFIDHITSASIYVNVSPRFQRYPKGGVISLGMSVANSYCGGPILSSNLTVPQRIIYS
ncbi:MAG: aldehyde dehydrogenase family protein [Cyanobacteria bacterium P01_F01_bin.150]